MVRVIAPRGAPIAERLAFYAAAAPNSCIVWTAGRDKNGYGKVQIGGRDRRVHRVAFELEHGPLPPGVMVRHSCDNPPCFNKHHLIAGSALLNAQDRVQRSRFNRNSPRYNRVRLDMAKAREIRSKAAEGVLHRVLAEQYGVGKDQISRVVNNINWKEAA